ncbi:tannase and feruloyl esterase [Coniochaeta ligniaria NRRL 30616]|uniref:Carboxylic ester hydrolase n=1 Tax=Coniochaeta ligniaria NRRL 30616 TaxID=1408157 RepID=A0A1J7JZB7_9PEZI|nr:tannase and feruloyl esterase [Coniochaeta ligniaria NRRL 30616]
MARRRLGQLVLCLGLCDVSQAVEDCSTGAFTYPDVFGAEFVSLSAAPVEDWKLNTTTPEGALIPTSGLSFCNVTLLYHHPGQNDNTNVQVWLPLQGWNERFVGVGGGGFAAGKLNGENLAATVNLGYAASVTDAGHDSQTWSRAPWVLNSQGNFNYPLIYNFATLSIHDMTIIGKAITQQYYGRAPKYSYFNGCSTGGRQGVTSAQRYPEDYDGILAGAPAINLPDLTVSTYWPQSVMDRLGYYPSKCELDAINRLSVEACDALDGVKDGFIADPDACDFDPQTVVGQTVDCGNGTSVRISTQTASIVRAIREGPTGADGKSLWVGTAHGTPFTGALALANTNCSEGGVSNCTGVPFPMAVDWIKNFTRRDPGYDVTKMTLADLETNYYLGRQQLGPIIAANDPDLSRFRALNRKLLTWHGLADECITMRGSRLYYDRVLQVDQNASDYFRHFEAPGVNHCAAGAGAFYPLRALAALTRWVEGGIAPDVLIGYKLPNATTIAADPQASRPVCRYPQVLRYKGGDVGSYGSFGCAARDAKETTGVPAARRRDEL